MGTINLVTDIPGPKSKAITDRKERVVAEPLDLHAPVVIDHAEGAAFTDVDGNTFLEFSGGIGCHAVGYSHPKVVEAVVSAAKRFSHTDFTIIPYESYIELSERLVALTGGDRKVALFNSGAEAVENSVKIARAATGRQGIIAFEGAFHGRTLMAMSLTSRVQPYKSKFGPFAPEVYRVPFPYPYRSHEPENAGVRALEAFERALITQVDPDNVAAVIVEPVQGEGGFVVPTSDFLPGLAEICAKHGILLIADEIQTGYGRTGRFFAYEHAGIQPDLVLVAKSLANGYPLSGVIGRTDVMDSLAPSTIGGTYVGNPVACAAANAVLDVIEEEGLVDRANQIAKTIRERWEEVARQAPEVGDIRGIGSMIGVEFVKDPATKEPNKEIVGKAIIGAMKLGVVAITCGIYKNVIRHLMPLVITDEQLEEGLDVLTDSVISAR